MNKKLKCPFCKGTKIHRSGHLADGTQRYRCLSCNHIFHERTVVKEPLDKVCPYCGSSRLRKSGRNKSGTQRYYCNDCGRKSSDNEVQIFFADINTDIECPYCHSHNLKKGGHLKSGAQRYICNDCDRYFSDKTTVKKDLGLTCPTCGSHEIGTCGVEHGKQRYRCKSCRRRFVLNPTIRDFKKYEKECPRCHHKLAKAAGHTGDGKPYYKCLECGHKYLENPCYRQTTKKERNKIKKLYRKGLTYDQISSELDRNARTIRTIIKKYRETLSANKLNKIKRKRNLYKTINKSQIKSIETKQKEMINTNLKTINEQIKGRILKQQINVLKREICIPLTKEQQKMIYKFGVLLELPINEVAQYAYCSIQKCKAFIDKFMYSTINKPIKIKVQVSEKDRKMDWVDLDRFVS